MDIYGKCERDSSFSQVKIISYKTLYYLDRNLRSCSSAMYTVFMDIFKDSLPIIQDNQFAIEADKKIKTQRFPPAAHKLNRRKIYYTSIF